MLTQLSLRHFRCFEKLECEFAPGANLFVGSNAQGKTSLLEAVCVLLRLQSPRVSALARAISHDRRGFVLDGFFARRHLQFYFSKDRKKLALDGVEQKSAQDYLEVGRAVFFSSGDLETVRGSGDKRRRYLDFIAAQTDSVYRRQWRAFDKALRSRNQLLKAASPNSRQLAAFDEPLMASGAYLMQARSLLVQKLQPLASAAHRGISDCDESLLLHYVPGVEGDFSAGLERARPEDLRLRQTNVGPHRDDLQLLVNGKDPTFASEGQQRTIALALKLAQATLLEEQFGTPPLLLLDDIFGELDLRRRNALLSHLGPGRQKLITTTHPDWIENLEGVRVSRISRGTLVPPAK